MIDLRDSATRKAFLREYLFRVGGVAFAIISLLLVANLILMVPTFLFLSESVKGKEHTLALLKQEDSSDVGKVEARVQALSDILSRLEEKNEETPLSNIFERALESAPFGIQILSLEYSKENNESILIISGVASTRDDLLSFSRALEARDDITHATYPVENLADEKNLDFSITVKGAP
jgi:hypothetical protein